MQNRAGFGWRRHIVLLLFFIAFLAAAWFRKPFPSLTPLATDEVDVYHAFLESWRDGAEQPVNLGVKTLPLRDSCGQDVDVSMTRSLTYALRPEDVRGLRVRLVEGSSFEILDEADTRYPAQESVQTRVRLMHDAGLLEVSEVAFNYNRTLAVMRYSFVCGSLCGEGATLVFRRKAGKWSRTQAPCSRWIS